MYGQMILQGDHAITSKIFSLCQKPSVKEIPGCNGKAEADVASFNGIPAEAAPILGEDVEVSEEHQASVLNMAAFHIKEPAMHEGLPQLHQ